MGDMTKSMMTRQHYTLLAQVMADTRPVMITKSPSAAQWEKTVFKLADELQATNTRFDRMKFIDACNKGEIYPSKHGRKNAS